MQFLKYMFFLLPAISLAQEFSDLKLLKKSGNELVYEIAFQEFEIQNNTDEAGKAVQIPSFLHGAYSETAAAYALPARMLKFAIPENGDLTAQLIAKSVKTYSNVTLKKSPLRENEITHDYNQPLIILGDKVRFRDFITKEIQINPLTYNEAGNTVVFTEKLTFKVTISGGDRASNTSFKRPGRLDALYPKLITNYTNAKSWQIEKSARLAKVSSLSAAKYYGLKVENDGIYKISAATLNNYGIETEDLNVSALQLYNNGGHELSLATNAGQHNPPFTREVAIRVFDLNNNNLFDGADYFLFYGKSLSSWFYDENTATFKFQKHQFATNNIYYLSTDGAAGKRMALNELAVIPGAVNQNYFIERFHYENDSYNLLHSGPDWYGHRFFGKSGSFSINFNLENVAAVSGKSRIELQMKGGSGIHYGDDLYYRYEFDIFINNNALNFNFNNSGNIFFYASRVTKNIDLNDNYLQNNQNTLSFNFSSNQDESSAHLDYFSIFYPKTLSVSNDYLSFFTDSEGLAKRYNLSGFGNINDLYLLDVSDPVAPIILAAGQPAVQNFQLDIPASTTAANIIAFSLSSSKITNITGLTSYTPRKDLLSTSNSADFIIITRNSLKDYGQQIAEIRAPLKTEVVTMEDINFFFNSGVQDPVAIRNFLRYAYYNWQAPSVSYVLLLGDGHYDYRNISISDSIIVPTFQIYAEREIAWGNPESRESDIFYGQIESSDNTELQLNIKPSIAVGRLPVENSLDAQRVVEKLVHYKENPLKDGWQMYLTFVGDDEKVGNANSIEWQHQRDAERLAKIPGIARYLKKKIYLSAYDEVPGGFGRLKPEATRDLIDQINRGTLILNFTGHGSPSSWAHETVFNFDRDYSKINNEYKYPLIIAATCDFGLFDDPSRISFTEALIWKERAGAIGVLAATRLVYSSQNFAFSDSYYRNLFPNSQPSRSLGEAYILALNSKNGNNINDQKYHLLADPSMNLAGSRESIQITNNIPDTLKALSRVDISATILSDGQINTQFNGGAIIVINDAFYNDLQTGGDVAPTYDMDGPLIFKGEVSVTDGQLSGSFIVPKTIRYVPQRAGRISLYAWDEATNQTAGAYRDDLLFNGSASLNQENDGPDIDIFFDGQENFSSGDIIASNPVLIANISDDSGINISGQLGHKIRLTIDDETAIDIGESFVYNKDSYKEGFIHYPLTDLAPGQHRLSLQAYDNLNNKSDSEISFSISSSDGLVLEDLINYPNPFRKDTEFTFQTNENGADITIKIYTISGRLIQTLDGLVSISGYNAIEWDGLDRDGNELANGVYLYKIILKYNGNTVNKIEKMVVLK